MCSLLWSPASPPSRPSRVCCPRGVLNSTQKPSKKWHIQAVRRLWHSASPASRSTSACYKATRATTLHVSCWMHLCTSPCMITSLLHLACLSAGVHAALSVCAAQHRLGALLVFIPSCLFPCCDCCLCTCAPCSRTCTLCMIYLFSCSLYGAICAGQRASLHNAYG